jgi:hypothetical protein
MDPERTSGPTTSHVPELIYVHDLFLWQKRYWPVSTSKCRRDHYSDREKRENKNFDNHSTPLNDHLAYLQIETVGLLHGPKIRSHAHARFDASPSAVPQLVHR